METETALIKVALRFRAVYLDVERPALDMNSAPTAPVLAMVRRLNENGFTVNEELLHALNACTADTLVTITRVINEVMGVDLNWAPLVKGWDTPTGEGRYDHLMTFFANLLPPEMQTRGTRLPCGHFIPEGTFPIERYNGCPFCGRQFTTANFVYKGQGTKLKELRLFTADDMRETMRTLLASPTPLDETQKESLKTLLAAYPLPKDVEITMKETAMLVVKALVSQGRDDEAGELLKTPADLLRYLWYEKTGLVQVLEPRTLVRHSARLNSHMWGPLDKSSEAAAVMRDKLRLKYNRGQCRRAAKWLNATRLTPQQAAENMHPKRGMWVRMIHALRLGEYSRRQGFEHLAEILDVFYRQNYTVWQGEVERLRASTDSAAFLRKLQERPGMFARSLFAAMLRFGSDETLSAFREVTDRLPVRLLLSLTNAAEMYFDKKQTRLARPITGGTKIIEPNKLLALYSDDECQAMVKAVTKLFADVMHSKFAAQKNESKNIYIDPQLYNIPVGVGDRATTVQDISAALMGTRFPVEGDAVRLFMQWGKGLPAQHLDMDLSSRIYLSGGRHEDCAYYNLTCVGAKHSGDIREIPNKVGTAEYIELSLPELQQAGAEYVIFTCNAYSNGALSPNLTVGWMSAEQPMKVSNETGVAYDPSTVQHMVRVNESELAKGLIFGVLDVNAKEIVWLEMPFTSQTIMGTDSEAVRAFLHRLQEKLSVGQLLDLKAQAQGLTAVDTPDEADESYTYEWALNPAAVAALLNC